MPIFKHNLRASKTAADVRFSGNLLIVTLNDGRFLRVPLEDIEWLHWLLTATPAQRAQWSLEPGGFAVYWDALDDGFEIEHLLAMPEVQVLTHVGDRRSVLA
jgi:hypothetical protein